MLLQLEFLFLQEKYVGEKTTHNCKITLKHSSLKIDHVYYLSCWQKFIINFAAKYIISTPLMIENPVRSPMVPPIADNISTNFAALSLKELVDGDNSKLNYAFKKRRHFFFSKFNE